MEIEFTLPQGYVDEQGAVHRNGRMRLATTLDEIEPMQDQRVQANPSYLPLLLLPRVITQLGGLTALTPAMMERMYAVDLAYLGDLYLRLNSPEHVTLGTTCPHCQNGFQVQVAPLHGV